MAGDGIESLGLALEHAEIEGQSEGQDLGGGELQVLAPESGDCGVGPADPAGGDLPGPMAEHDQYVELLPAGVPIGGYFGVTGQVEYQQLRRIEASLQVYQRKTLETVIGMGLELAEARAVLGDGGFTDWAEVAMGIKKSTAYNFLATARRFVNSPFIPSLGKTALEVVYVVAQDSVQQAAVEEVVQRIENGERLDAVAAREIVARHSGRPLGRKAPKASSAPQLPELDSPPQAEEGAGAGDPQPDPEPGTEVPLQLSEGGGKGGELQLEQARSASEMPGMTGPTASDLSLRLITEDGRVIRPKGKTEGARRAWTLMVLAAAMALGDLTEIGPAVDALEPEGTRFLVQALGLITAEVRAALDRRVNTSCAESLEGRLI